jgi:myosin heavy subunit
VPAELDHHRLVEQLSYSGVLEVIRVTRAGYATRFLLGDFADRFFVLMFRESQRNSSKRNSSKRNSKRTSSRKSRSRNASKKNKVPSSLRDKCQLILTSCDLEFGQDYQIGHTKVFMRPHAFTRLEVLKAERLKRYVLRLQAFARGVVLRQRFKDMRWAARQIQPVSIFWLGHHPSIHLIHPVPDRTLWFW